MIASDADLDEIAAVLNKSKTITIYAGAGCEGAHDEVVATAARLKAPMAHTSRGKDFVEYDNPYNVGMTGMIGGKYPMIPDMAMGMVDVRDVAKIHVAAMTTSGAAGKRFIACTAEPIEMTSLAKILREDGYTKAPSFKAPTFLLKLMSLFDRETKGMLPYIGKKATLDNSATLKVLNWKPTPMANSFKEMAAALSQ